MDTNRTWGVYSPDFRAKEIKIIAKWIEAGESGAVVGLNGAGKSNLLGFLCHRPEIFKTHFSARAGPVALIPVDLNNLPATDLSSFYRVILRSFFEIRRHFDQPTQQTITDIYQANRSETDSFLAQSAVRELLFYFQDEQTRVVLVLNGFDYFCEIGTLPMFNTLRALRDGFKDTLCYLVGMRQVATYLPEPEILGELFELLDTQICWVGPMSEADSRYAISSLTYTAPAPLEEIEIEAMLALTGGYPALLKAACHWWLAAKDKPPIGRWRSILLAHQGVRYRLEQIWHGLTQEEQLALTEVQKLEMQFKAAADDPRGTAKKRRRLVNAFGSLTKQYPEAMAQLKNKGLYLTPQAEMETVFGQMIFSRLLANYVADMGGRSRGKIWLDEKSEEFYQGQTRLNIQAPKERAILTFLVKNPRMRHTHTDLMEQAWTDEEIYAEKEEDTVSLDSLFQLIRKLRKRIEPNSTKPCYIVNWRGRPEGGYQFFPEGRPG